MSFTITFTQDISKLKFINMLFTIEKIANIKTFKETNCFVGFVKLGK